MSYKGKNIWGLEKTRVELRTRCLEKTLKVKTRMSNRFFSIRHARFFIWVLAKM